MSETPLTQVQIRIAELKASKDGYVHRVLVAFDQFVNVVFRGRLGETISARSGRAALEGKIWGLVTRSFLDLFQKNHTELAQAGDLERAETIEVVEKKVLD